MVIYLRNENKETLVDIEIYEKDNFIDLNSSVMIRGYSNLLLSQQDKEQVIADFDFISELRGWFHESYCESVDDFTINDVIKEVTEMLNKVALRYNLAVITD